MALIVLEHVTHLYQYGNIAINALVDINLTIDRGEFLALWGPSGSGKTTLCNLIGTLDYPTTGEISINGKNIADMTDSQQSEYRNNSIGFIFQDFNLIDVLNAMDNVMLPLRLQGQDRLTAATRAKELLCAVGLEKECMRRPKELSGGQQQRVAVARALVTRPLLVIADEPTANLDSENASQIISLMKHFNTSMGVTFILSTHDEMILQQVNRRIRLKDGQIVQDITC